MSEEMIPKVPVAPEELDSGDMPVVPAQAEETAEAMPDLSGKSLAELAGLFEELSKKEDRMKLYKEAEAIKSAFYKRLLKEKTDAGLEADVKEPDDRLPDNEETEADAPAGDTVSENPFGEIERGFKELYNAYKKERSEYNRQQEKEREHNLALKVGIHALLISVVELPLPVEELVAGGTETVIDLLVLLSCGETDLSPLLLDVLDLLRERIPFAR